jgi:hypothetical protein
VVRMGLQLTAALPTWCNTGAVAASAMPERCCGLALWVSTWECGLACGCTCRYYGMVGSWHLMGMLRQARTARRIEQANVPMECWFLSTLRDHCR